MRAPRDQDIAEAHHRLSLVETWLDLSAEGQTPRALVKRLGVPRTTIWRHLTALRAAGIDWSDLSVRADQDQRRRAIDALTPGNHRSGRRPLHPTLDLDEAATFKLETLYVATIGAASDYMTGGRRSGSVATALKRFAEEPECPADLRESLRDGRRPAALVRQLRRITPEMEARIRGEKHYQLHGALSRRDMTLRLPDGRRAAIPAGYLVEFDDMSANQPFYVELPDGKTLISRQGLYARDLRTGRWIGVDLVARPREAYRAEDILRFLRRLMEACGKFDMLRLEQGIWAARVIKGFKIEENGDVIEEDIERPEMPDDERTKLQDGLAAIGIRIDYATSAHQKVIETGFNHLQRILATYTTEFINIGRHAGEFEHGAKQLRRIRAGSHTPAQCGFVHIDTLAERIERAFVFINKAKNSRGEVPDQVWAADLAARPLPSLVERDYAAFFPDVRECQVRGSMVTCRVDGQPHDFAADVFNALGTGYRVFVRFDSTEPTLGAAIYNRETSSANHYGFREGDFVTFARWECPGPQADVPSAPGLVTATAQEIYGETVIDDGLARRQRSEKFVRTAFRALPHPGQPAVKRSSARDGQGNVAEVAVGSAAAPAPAAPPKSSRRPFLAPPTPEEISRTRSRLAESASAARELREMQEQQT